MKNRTPGLHSSRYGNNKLSKNAIPQIAKGGKLQIGQHPHPTLYINSKDYEIFNHSESRFHSQRFSKGTYFLS